MSKKNIIPLILSGGSGSRLWPLSRKSFPKQFLPLFDHKTLFNLTLDRIKKFDKFSLDDLLIISNVDYRDLVKTELSGLEGFNITTLYEPLSKNTAPAVTISCLKAQDLYSDEAYILIMPSDHLIEDNLSFKDSIYKGIKLVDKETLIFFGIHPTKPHTGYGYIKYRDDGDYPRVEEFIEKPDLNHAEKFLKDKNYLWNAGIFLVNAEKFISLIKQVDPKFLENCKLSLEFSKKEKNEIFLNEDFFSKLKSISVDH